jgi:hypothetical protein
MTFKSPYPYFGGKSGIAREVWRRLGNVDHFVDPFFGSGALLLSRPADHFDAQLGIWPLETVNDLDGFIANFWRAIAHDPGAVARYADWPANQNDLTARHYWLVQRHADLVRKLEADPEYFDAKIAGWWVWGAGLWFGHGYCSGRGPWRVVNGRMVKTGEGSIMRKTLRFSGKGCGVHRVTVGIKRQRVPMETGRGVHRMEIGTLAQSDSVLPVTEGIYRWFAELAARMRRVRVNCTGWRNMLTYSALAEGKTVGIVLDPPYARDERDSNIYVHENDIWHEVKQWAIDNGDNPRYRIAYFGYLHEGNMPVDWPAGWQLLTWTANRGFAGERNNNRTREVVYFSPNCLQPGARAVGQQQRLF